MDHERYSVKYFIQRAKERSTKSSVKQNHILILQVALSEELHNGLNDELKSINNDIEPNQASYDAVDSNGIGKFVDTVQGLSPAEVKAYGIDVNNDVYIDKPARQRPVAQRSLQNGYTTIGERDLGSFGNMKKSQVNKNNKKVSK